jgi:hypothetical protein
MAAIDKLYVRTYAEYDDLRRWALVYYPKLLIYFYSIDLRLQDFMHAQPIMNTPVKVDSKLKWICPVPCVREYLHKQCGVNQKWEWLYKILWRGKKYF